MFNRRGCKIGIIGLGYVGLPLAVEFGKRYETVGFDLKSERVAELNAGRDSTLEVEPGDLQAATRLTCTDKLEDMESCDVYIVSVPTPIDDHQRPDLSPLLSASKTVGKVLKPGNVVIYDDDHYYMGGVLAELLAQNGASQQSVAISGNVLSENGDGVRVATGSSTVGISCTGNDIVDNTDWGVINEGDGILDARDNWWGSTRRRLCSPSRRR